MTRSSLVFHRRVNGGGDSLRRRGRADQPFRYRRGGVGSHITDAANGVVLGLGNPRFGVLDVVGEALAQLFLTRRRIGGCFAMSLLDRLTGLFPTVSQGFFIGLQLRFRLVAQVLRGVQIVINPGLPLFEHIADTRQGDARHQQPKRDKRDDQPDYLRRKAGKV